MLKIEFSQNKAILERFINLSNKYIKLFEIIQNRLI